MPDIKEVWDDEFPYMECPFLLGKYCKKNKADECIEEIWDERDQLLSCNSAFTKEELSNRKE